MNKEANREINGETNKGRKLRFTMVFFLLLVMFFAGVLYGAVPVTGADLWNLISGGENTAVYRILAYVRVPRVAGAFLAGAALALSGAVIQTVLGNTLAGPNIIGVNAGAGFMVVLIGAVFPAFYTLLPLAAFLGAFITVMTVYLLAKKTGSSKITLVLSGIAVNSLLNAATDTVYTLHEDSLLKSSAFRMGGLEGIRLQILIPAGIVILLSLLMVLMLHNELEVLSLGGDTAKSLGLPVSFYRFLFLALAASLAGAAVSFAGLLGFVGLVVPHVARMLFGEEQKYFLLASALLGALFVMGCDLLARILFAPYELPVGIILSFTGAPFFVYLLIRQRRQGG